MPQLTPLMEQYQRIKNQHKDKILFFRMGDFFEMFDKDAEIAAPILNIALTYRNKKAGLKTKMCGLPHHSISAPISKLLAEGLHVAICDQMESAVPGSKTLVKRAVTRVLSPGMVYDLESLDSLQANHMAAFDKKHISFLDLSTGSAFYYEISNSSDLFKLLEQFAPSELVLTSSQKEKSSSAQMSTWNLSVFERNLFTEKNSSLPSSFLQKYQSCPESAKRLLSYVYCMQGEDSLKIVKDFERQTFEREMYYSPQLYAHLEIFKNYEGSSRDTLFSAINRTKTPNAARLLKRRLKSPLIDQKELENRLDKIDYWISRPEALKQVRLILGKMGDGERKLGKLAQAGVHARDLLSLSEWLKQALELETLVDSDLPLESQKKALEIKNKIQHIISPSCPPGFKEGGMIREGVNPQLDEWIRLSKDSQTFLLEMEKKEQNELHIPSLKIRYNNIFGYYIEVRKIHSSKIPSHYKRKQTLVNAERYSTEELDALEKKILSARAKQVEMEGRIFQDLKSELLKELSFLMGLCDYWSEMDLYSSLAFLAIENKYVRPRFAGHFKLQASRHPVLEQKSFHEFVPNNVDLPQNHTLILTGPNMAGKSTLMRQLALTVLLAQSGSFVPASLAEIPLFHKMFTRIGASDLLSQGLSTFMVEMKETAEILEKSDEKSFIILDEIGRGTATFDGMSLAQAILEFLSREKKPLLFSATHYQELTDLEKKIPSLSNASMAIREDQGDMHFLYLLKPGPANKSYGIQVARLAGLPASVLNRARGLLDQYEKSSLESERNSVSTLESEKRSVSTSRPSSWKSVASGDEKAQLQNQKSSLLIKSLIKELSDYPLMTQRPIDAMNQIQKWQEKLQALSGKKAKKALKTKTLSSFDEDAQLDILN